MKYETTLLSVCHHVPVKDADNDGTYYCPQCDKLCDTIEVCIHCMGTGEYIVDHEGERIKTQVCICQS